MNKIKYLMLTLAVITFSGCSNWLSVEPETSVDEEKLFSTEQGFKDAMAGVYADMASSSLYGQNLGFGFLDVLAQQYDYNTLNSTYSSFYRVKDYEYTYSTVKSQIASIWLQMYNTIAEINNIFRWMDKNGNVLSEPTKHRIKGQCHIVRAYLHYDLLRLFAPDVLRKPNEKGIPYVETFGITPTGSSTVAEVIAKIKNDLAIAKEELKDDPIFQVVPFEIEDKTLCDQYVAQANYYTAEALLARVYLDEGKYKEARDAALRVIGSGKFQLVDYGSSIDVPKEKLDILFNDEHIFSLRNTNIRTYSENLHLGKSENGTTSGAALPLTSNIQEIFDGNNDDLRYSTWIRQSDSYLMKYNQDIKRFYPKQVLIKLSEMYLICAEAKFRLNEGDALETLNILRRSRITNPATSDKYLIDEKVLLSEIRREFIGEGQLFFQYKRLNSPIYNILNEVEPSDRVFVLPIPDSELEYGKY